MFKPLKIVLILFLSFCFNHFYAQVANEALPYQQKVNLPGAAKAKEGTFQIIKIGAKTPQELFTDDLLYLIEANRDTAVDVEIKIGDYTKVKILPYNVINDPDFVPLSGEIVVESAE